MTLKLKDMLLPFWQDVNYLTSSMLLMKLWQGKVNKSTDVHSTEFSFVTLLFISEFRNSVLSSPTLFLSFFFPKRVQTLGGWILLEINTISDFCPTLTVAYISTDALLIFFLHFCYEVFHYIVACLFFKIHLWMHLWLTHRPEMTTLMVLTLHTSSAMAGGEVRFTKL